MIASVFHNTRLLLSASLLVNMVSLSWVSPSAAQAPSPILQCGAFPPQQPGANVSVTVANNAWVVYELGANYQYTCLRFSGYSNVDMTMLACISKGCPQTTCQGAESTAVEFTGTNPVIDATTPVHASVGAGNSWVGFYFETSGPLEPELVLQMTQYNCSAENQPSPSPVSSPSPTVNVTASPAPSPGAPSPGASPNPSTSPSPGLSPSGSPSPARSPKGINTGSVVAIILGVCVVLVAGFAGFRYYWSKSRTRELQPLLINQT